MARYCEANDLRALVPDVYRDAALADSFGGANADPGMLDLVLSSACDEVDALISGRVRLPLPPDAIPSKLRTAAALFAAEILYIRRGLEMPSALAEKVKWWRDWLSKIGEGDLRLAATPESDDEAAKSSAYMPAAITARPAITGSHGLLGAIALLLSLGAGLLPGLARAAVGHRTFSLSAPPDPATFSSVPAIVWERGESVTLELSGATLAPGQHPSWQVADPTNLWMAVESDDFSFHASPEAAAIPPGRYAGRVVVTNADSSLVRVLAVQDIRVLPGASDLAPPDPASSVATTAWVEALAATLSNALHAADAELEADIQGIAGDLARQAQDLAAVEEDVSALGGRLEAVEADYATETWVEDYVAENVPEPDLSGYVAKTNGEWVIVQGTAWNGIEWQGERVFGVEMDVTTNGMAIITDMEVLATNRLLLSFRGAATNRLEACCDTTSRETWETWDGCSWERTGETTGRVLIEGASPDCWYRVMPEAPVVDSWSNVSVVARAPLYLGGKDSDHRAATRADVATEIARAERDAGPRFVPRFAFEDAMNPAPTNLAWKFALDGPYIRHLQIGGQTYDAVSEEGGAIVTNTVTNAGSLTLNGITWTAFPDIGGQIYEEVVEVDGQIVTNIWENPGSLELDGVTITNWAEVADAFPAALRARLLEAWTFPAVNLNGAIARANAAWNAMDAATAQSVAPRTPSALLRKGADAPRPLLELPGEDAWADCWIARETGGFLANEGSDGADGLLSRMEGVALSTNLPPPNTGGASLAFSSTVSGTAVAESSAAYDPLAGATAFTLMAWVRRTGAAGSGTASRILSDVETMTATAATSGVDFRFSGADGKLTLRVNDSEVSTSSGLVAPSDGQWHHVAVVYDGTRPATNYATRNVHFYLDGVQKGVGNSLVGAVPGPNSVPLSLGSSAAGRIASAQFVGEMDDVFVFRGWAPEPSGNGATNAVIAAYMSLDDETLAPRDDPIAPFVLGEMPPASLLYSAEQVDALLDALSRRIAALEGQSLERKKQAP